METALITGASSGIGLELAKIFAAHNYNLILVARREERLREIAQELTSQDVQVHIIPSDLSEVDASQKLFDETQKRGLPVDILVNNAGFGLEGSFLETDWEKEDEMICLNILTLTGLTKYFMHHMVEQGKGKILNVASTAAFLPGPFMSVYYASKAYVLSFSKALAYELKDTNVTVSVLCPGPTKTEFQDRAGVQNSALFSGKRMPVSTAREVAQAGFNGLMKGKTVIIPGLLNRIGVVGSRFSPSSVTNRMVEELHRSR